MHSLREPRVPMQLRVEILGTDWEGKPYQESTFTSNISRTGTRLSRASSLRRVGERVELRRGKDKAPYTVIWIGTPGSQVEGQIGMRCLDPIKNIWGVPLPPSVRASSDEEWAKFSAGLPAIAPVDETGQPQAAQSAAPGGATLEAEEATGVEEIPVPLEAPEATPALEPVAAQSDSKSGSLEEAFARLQAEEPADSGEPTATLPTSETAAPDAPPAYPEQSRGVFAAADDNEGAPAELPAPSVEPDTVTYGPQFLPEPQTPATKPFYQRPVIYLGIGAALLLLLVISWTRTRTVPTQPEASSPVSASSTEPAPISSGPAAPPPATVQETPPAPNQPQPTQTQPLQIEQVPQPQTAPPKVRAVVPVAAGNFAVQVGAYESAATAQALANSLGSRYDCKGIVDTVETSGKTLHRVRLLAPSQADAKALAARVRRERAFDAIVVKLD